MCVPWCVLKNSPEIEAGKRSDCGKLPIEARKPAVKRKLEDFALKLSFACVISHVADAAIALPWTI